LGVGDAKSGDIDVTQRLLDWKGGDPLALNEIAPVIYGELRKLAAVHLRHERRDHTLSATAVVHEAWLRLIDQNRVTWQNRAHFFGIAARFVRRVLVDHARARSAAKRTAPDTLAFPVTGGAPTVIEVLDLDRALEELAAVDEGQSRIVELRFFAGMSIEETAEALGISPATVKREWAMARAWLLTRLNP
jgi:RNA polymerase sigma factor (TIGR02999 family)